MKWSGHRQRKDVPKPMVTRTFKNSIQSLIF